MFDFEFQEINQAKILRKLWCATLQIGVKGVKGEKGTFTYPPVVFLPLGEENSNKIFIKYSTVRFGIDPCSPT